MTACKVSIIVPVYNTSEYLKNCIDSLLAQTLNEIEIIAVNDGSTDNSFQILKEYQALHPNKVYVYNTENKGVSHARNFGVTKSSGQYLWFVDSDDCVEPNACEELYNKATKDDNDLVLFSRYDVNAESGEKIGNLTAHYNQNFKVSEKPYELLKLSPFPWNKFIKKELFEGIEFPDKIRFEDLPVSFILATKAKSIGVINDFFYNYSVQVGFLSKFTESTIDISKAIDFLINNLKERDCFDLYKNEIEYITVRHFFYRFEQLLTVYGEESFELKVKLINTLFDYLEEHFPNFRKNKYIEYNLPDRLNKLFGFYSSREALLDFVAKCKDMSKEEQDAYVQKLTSENEVPRAFEFKTFDKIKEESNDKDKKYNKLRKESSIKKEILYVTAQEHAVPSSMLAMIKYIKAEKNDYEQLITVNSGNIKESEERLKRYNLSDIQIITRDDEKYLKSLSEAEYIFSDCGLEYYFAAKNNQSRLLSAENVCAFVACGQLKHFKRHHFKVAALEQNGQSLFFVPSLSEVHVFLHPYKNKLFLLKFIYRIFINRVLSFFRKNYDFQVLLNIIALKLTAIKGLRRVFLYGFSFQQKFRYGKRFYAVESDVLDYSVLGRRAGKHYLRPRRSSVAETPKRNRFHNFGHILGHNRAARNKRILSVVKHFRNLSRSRRNFP